MNKTESILLVLFIVMLLTIIGLVGGCVPEQLVQGCRVEEDNCVCGLGCDTAFRYTTREQCQTALKERRDRCSSSPCKHGGLCTPSSNYRGFRCLCANTGFYGYNCHKKCPMAEYSDEGEEDIYPIECMVI